ncbi:hypothetical protein N0V83_007136 [Neocucurbitaria cava]|uniref:Lytic polysaccharide monooxygenase n=1 Tax=Neocucurbitaria cava TaxID=798079 RepID=A0A9W8Y717_9PLEO|nr:hypothetical protein N0V83_007136 [Neocucurbitaria cava]
MMSQKSTLLAAMLVMAPLAANAHMIMANPLPYGHPNNSPLDPSGSDFPCKSVPYTVNTMNEWPVGSSQYLSFTGSAVHGGGSCQISVTTDKALTKDSKWKVIYSIEGGCPASVAGNLDETKNSDGRFNFTIPSELPNGEMSMAWTWYNKVGNREMYMNCGPIKVSGGANDNTAFDALPDMAVANLAITPNCKTKESSDYTFENPGKYKISAGTGPYVSLCGGAPSTGGDAPAPAPQQPAASQSPPANPGNSSACRAPSQAPVQTSTLRTMVTVTAPLGPAPTSAQGNVSAPSANSPSAPQPSQAPAAPAAPAPAPSSGTANGSSCSPDGSILCNGETQFGICNHGTVVWQAVAAGTKCQNDAIAKRDYAHRNMRTAF